VGALGPPVHRGPGSVGRARGAKGLASRGGAVRVGGSAMPAPARWEWLTCRALWAAAKAWARNTDCGEADARVGCGGVRLGRRDHAVAAARTPVWSQAQ